MPKGGKTAQTEQDAETQALRQEGTLASEGQAAYGALMPELQTMAANPQGYSPATLASQRTETMQGAGGTQAGATGEGALLESRTKNPGSARAAIASSSRGAGEELGRRGLGVETNNAKLKTEQQSRALGELGGVYGTGVSGSNQAAGEVANTGNATTNAANENWNWARYILDPAMQAASKG